MQISSRLDEVGRGEVGPALADRGHARVGERLRHQVGFTQLAEGGGSGLAELERCGEVTSDQRNRAEVCGDVSDHARVAELGGADERLAQIGLGGVDVLDEHRRRTAAGPCHELGAPVSEVLRERDRERVQVGRSGDIAGVIGHLAGGADQLEPHDRVGRLGLPARATHSPYSFI